ncbi:hypothetical protein [Thomasclavelia saccharogumia]|uniref:hypothetical protein n=1 Tax=Thomasclavelia saccharogumia TaxID=341225 RepID=UPI00047948DC|nr:hypothetical protein [Thomasclavelia saccharogumia]
MKQIDTDKIKTMVNDRIAYDLYERNRTMKKIKLKKAAFSIAVCILILGGISTVDAATDGKISNTVKNTIKVIFTDENNQEREITGEQYVDENGDIWIKYKHESDQSNQEIDINKSELEENGLEADGNIKNSDGETNTEITIQDK